MKRVKITDGTRQMNLIGTSIRAAREKAGLTQMELSIKLETIAVYICRGSISRIESGERIVTDIEIAGLSKILCVSIESLFRNSGASTGISDSN